MHVGYPAAVLLLCVATGCVHREPDTPVPEPRTVATPPNTPKPAAKPVAPATPQPPPAAAPAPRAQPSAPPAGKVAPSGAKAPAAPSTLDLNALEEQLKETKAIGFFTKITLKNQVDDLLDQFREYYQGKAKLTMKDLRRSYDLLMMKVLSLLQDEDQRLASAIVASREAIWGLLADPVKFKTLQA